MQALISQLNPARIGSYPQVIKEIELFCFCFLMGKFFFSITHNSLQIQPEYISNQSQNSEQEMSQFWREVNE